MVLGTSTGWAQTAGDQTAGEGPSKEQLRAARALADAGFELFKSGKYEEAYNRFRGAEDIFHAPPHVMFMARSAAKLGRYVQARDLFASLANEELDASAPKPFHQAKKEAAIELEEVEAKMATLKVEVTGPSAPTILIDGEDRTEAALAGSVDLDPGEHRVRVTAEGYEPAEESVVLAEGARDEAVAFALTPLPTPEPEPVTTGPDEVEMEDGPLWPAFVLAGVGLAGIGVGAGMGVVAMNRASELDQACPVREQCPPERESLESDARLFGNISTGAFIGGGVLAAGSIVWFILRPFGGPADEAEAELSVVPLVGPGHLGMLGSF